MAAETFARDEGVKMLLPGTRHRGVARRQHGVSFASVTLCKKSDPQQQAAVPPDASKEGRKVAMKPASDIIAGAMARAASQSTIHPLDTLKVRMQVSSRAAPTTSGLSKIGQLVPPKGVHDKVADGVAQVRSLYRGVAGAASGAGIALGAYFACYGVATNALLKYTDMTPSTVAFVAGGMAAAGSSVVKVPLAVCIRSVQAQVYPNVFTAAGSIIQQAGVRGLFTGFLPNMLEDVPDMAFKFAAYESLRQLHSRLNGGRKANPSEDFAMGAVSGAFAAAATTPLDVIKTNMMTNAASRPTMLSASRAVYAQGGMSGFVRGIGPRALSNGINSAVFFCFFEAIRTHFARQAKLREARLEMRRQMEASLSLGRPLSHVKGDYLDDWDRDLGYQMTPQPVGASVTVSTTKTIYQRAAAAAAAAAAAREK